MFGLMTKKKHEEILRDIKNSNDMFENLVDELLARIENIETIPLPSKANEIKGIADQKNEAYKIATFKSVFNNKKGRLVLDYLRVIYSHSIPNFENPSYNYFMNGKNRVLDEIDSIINKQVKNKEKESK